MTGFIIHPRKGGDWRRHKDAILAISVGAPYHEGERFAAIVDWAAKRFDRLHVQIGDTLQRYNSIDSDAQAKSRAAGDAWLERNLPVVQATGKLASVTRWDDLLQKPEYPAVLSAFKAAAAENTQFKAALAQDAQRYLARQQDKLPDAEQRSQAYLLEEAAAITLHSRMVPGARLYPSPNLASLAMIEAGAIPDAPRGMERQQRLHLSIRSRGHG